MNLPYHVKKAHDRVLSIYLDMRIILACMTEQDLDPATHKTVKDTVYGLANWCRQLGDKRYTYGWGKPEIESLAEDFGLVTKHLPDYGAQFEEACRWARRAPDLSLLEVIALTAQEDEA